MNLNVKSLFFLTKALAKPLRAAAIARAARQGDQHRLDRRHLRQSERDLFLRREQGRGDPSDAADGDQADQGPHRRHRDRAGRVQVRHEPRRARPCGRGRQAHSGAAHRHRRGHGGASRSISPRAPAITWSATPSRSMAAWSTRMRGWRSRGRRGVQTGARTAAIMPRAYRRIRVVASRSISPPLRYGSRAFAGDDMLSTHVSIFTYSKSPGLLSMPTLGGEIQDA